MALGVAEQAPTATSDCEHIDRHFGLHVILPGGKPSLQEYLHRAWILNARLGCRRLCFRLSLAWLIQGQAAAASLTDGMEVRHRLADRPLA